MNSGQRRENARKFYNQVSQFIEPVIEKVGVHICKFAAECLLKYFKSNKKASTFIDQNSKLPDGSNLSVALEAVIDKIALINDPARNSHVHIISDMKVSFEDEILARPSLTSGSKITFHYYDASKNPENDFLKRMKTAYEAQKETLEPERKKRYSDSVELNFYRSKKLKE